jgi:Tol biopolymer transport system component
MIYTSVEAGAADPGLYFSAGDGAAAQLLGPDVRDIAYDPSGEKVAFVRAVTAAAAPPPPTAEGQEGEENPAPSEAVYYELFIAPVNDLAAATQITRFNGVISDPTWSPNGFQLAFVSNFSGNEDIWTITDDGLNFDNLTDSESLDRDPAWSPDGSRIVYVSDSSSPGLTKLFSMSATGEDQALLLDIAGNSYQPAWSFDGKLLAFVNDGNGDGDIYIAEADGQGSLLLTTDDGGAEDRSPSFTPDGRWLGFASNRDGASFNLYAVDLRGSSLVQLTDSADDQQELDFRPDLALRLRNQN